MAPFQNWKNDKRKSSSLNGTLPPPILEQLNNYSMCGTESLQRLCLLAEDIIKRDIPGDFVECGVCNGGSAAALAYTLRKTEKKMWLYDSFQGMPEVSEVDGVAAQSYVGKCIGLPEKVKEAMRISKLSEDRYIVRAGWFDDTFQQPLPETIALLHIDADWYDSVSLCLNTFYDRVSEGGLIILDDFGHWEGCREAFYDFICAHQLKPLIERSGHTQAFWVKERTHNREFAGQSFTLPIQL